jgi:hypothetical protein
MEHGKDKKTGPKRIGELLVAANVVRADKLLEALHLSKKTKSPIGRTLMSLGQLTEQDLEAAIELQALLRAGAISTEFGIRALNVAVKNRVSLQQAFVKLGWRPPMEDVVPISDLGELLLEAGIVTPRSLEEAVKNSKDYGLPLGRCLVVNKALNANILGSVLTAQVLMRDGKISKEQAVAGLKLAAAKQQSLEESLKESGTFAEKENNIKLGELLCAAGLLSETDKVSAIEVGLERKKPIGEILVTSGIIPSTILHECLNIQALIANRSLTSEEAVEILKESRIRRIPVAKVKQEYDVKRAKIKSANEVLDLIISANLLTPEQINAAQNATSITGATVGEVLLEAGLLNEENIEATAEAKRLYEMKVISVDQAMASLRYCFQKGVDFHRALQEAPWDFNDSQNGVDNKDSQEQRNKWLEGIWSKVRGKE